MAENTKLIVCPYCGHVQPAEDRCEECRGLFEPLSRRATQIAMGPWFVRDKMSPFRPGCSYEVLRKQITSGRVKPMSVIRGPTTHQFWAVAKNVPGVAHLLGYCHKCGNHLSPDDDHGCPACGESFKEPIQRDELGLVYPTATESGAAQKSLERELSLIQGTPPAQVTPGTTSAGWLPPKPAGAAEAGDLLDQVLSNAATKAGSTFLPSDPAAAKPVRKPSSKKRASPKKEPVTANVAQAVDFTPSEEGQIDTPTPRGSHSLMVWLLVGINVVILVILLVIMVVYLTRHTAATP